MVLGFWRYDGVFLPKTRISNTTDIISVNNLEIANNVFIWHHSILECSNGVSLGEGCQIGAYVLISSHSSHLAIRLYGRHYLEYNGRHIAYVKGPVVIGCYSFIGPHTLIMPNTKIGKGSIVAAYSLVKGEFPDFAIIGGNPAKIMGDTRDMDAKYLAEHPGLHEYYAEWANS